MAVGDGFTSRLLVGLAQHLHTNSIGTYRAAGAYAAGETGIVIRSVPQSPDRIITLAAYPVPGSPRGMADHLVGIQCRVRGAGQDPRDCDDLADAVYELLDGAARLTWGGIPVVEVWRQSYTSLGQDSSRRWERSENYYAASMRPTSNNTD